MVRLRELSPEPALSRLELSVGADRRAAQRRPPGFGLGPGSEPPRPASTSAGQDDVRRIDWNVTARTGEVHVRDLVADRELETWALVDATASMDFGTALMEKRDLAVAVVGAIGLRHRPARQPVRRRVACGDQLTRVPSGRRRGGAAAHRC